MRLSYCIVVLLCGVRNLLSDDEEELRGGMPIKKEQKIINPHGVTPLMVYFRDGMLSKVRLEIARGANVQDTGGWGKQQLPMQ